MNHRRERHPDGLPKSGMKIPMPPVKPPLEVATLRDKIMMAVLPTIYATMEAQMGKLESAASMAYAQADACLAEREKNTTTTETGENE